MHSLQLITGRTGEPEDSDNVSSNINISYDLQTPETAFNFGFSN
jgi:hypothetical protein